MYRYWACRQVPFLLALLAACGDDKSPKVTADDSAASTDDSGADVDRGVDGDDPAEDRTSDDAAGPDEPDPGQSGSDEGDANVSIEPKPSEADAGSQAGGGQLCEPGSDAPSHDLGETCHDFDFDAVSPLITPKVVDQPWPELQGGTVVPGTYDLVGEERFVPADASEQDVLNCTQYLGVYRERLVITDSDWLRLTRVDNTVGRQSFRYQAAAGEISRTEVCPEPDPCLPPYASVKYEASSAGLEYIEELHNADVPGSPAVCQFLYRYTRKR
jgi:hypothetical protein